MKNVMSVAAASVSVVGLSLVLAGCGSQSATQTSSASSSASSSPWVVSPSATPASAEMTINDYITKNNIAEVPIKPDQPGTPSFDFPFPPGWSPAGEMTPEWAYGAIVYDKPADPSDPPTMYAIAVQLTGDVDPATVLELAPSQLQAMPEFSPIGEPEKSSLSGFDAVQYAGTYMNEGKKRVAAQKTVVVPGKDALFALQLNADALDGQQDVILDAVKVIDEQTKITPPV